jgi:hypothetical protein
MQQELPIRRQELMYVAEGLVQVWSSMNNLAASQSNQILGSDEQPTFDAITKSNE